METITTETPLGFFTMEVNDRYVVVRSGFYGNRVRLPGHAYAEAVRAYFAGDVAALDTIPCAQTVSAFYADVYRAMAAIPCGKTASYADIAQAIGRPGAVRAVGTACGKNNLPLLVPCHRVVRSDGSTGQYLYGVDIKEWLLRHEGAIS